MHAQLLLPGGSRVAAALPRRWAEGLAEIAGILAGQCMPAARRVVEANLSRATGMRATQAARRGVFRTYARYYLGMMRLAHLPVRAAVGPMRLGGQAHLVGTLARGRGGLLLGAHVGNWDVAALALVERFGTLHAYVEPLRPEILWRFYTGVRDRHGVRVLRAGERRRTPFEVLRGNGLLGMLVDRPFGSRCTRVRFGSGALVVPTGGIRLGVRAGAGIHAVFALHRGDGHAVRVSADLTRGLETTGESESVRRVASRFAAALQRVVKRHPEQWCLLHPVGGGAVSLGEAACAGERGTA